MGAKALSIDLIEACSRLWKENKSRAEIISELRITIGCFAGMLYRFRKMFPPRPIAIGRNIIKPLTDNDIEQAKALWVSGLSTYTIGDKLGVTDKRISSLVRQHNFPDRVVAPKKKIQVEPKPAKPKLVFSQVRVTPVSTCQWISDSKGDATFPSYCRANVVPGFSYCRKHKNLCYLKKKEQADAA